MFSMFVFIFIVVTSAERLWWTFFKEKGKEKGVVKAKWTLILLNISHSIIIIGAILEYILCERTIMFFIAILGLCMFFVAFWLRRLCSRTLGRFQSLQIEIRKTHRLIKNGPYRYIRHPWYLSIILEVLSITLIFNAYYSLLYLIVVHIPIILLRVYFEEKALSEIFPDEYAAYKKEVWAFFPFKRDIKKD